MIPNNSYIALEGRSGLGNVRNNQATVVANNYAMFDGTTGKVIVDSGIPAGASGITGPVSSTVDNISTWNATDGTVLKDSGIRASTGTASFSVFIGTNRNPTANFCTALGHQSSPFNLGTYSTLVGSVVAVNTSGANITGVGAQALGQLGAATDSCALGRSAGYTLTTSTVGNLFLGTRADTDNAFSDNRTAIGNDSIATEDNQIMMGNASTTQMVPKSTALVELGTISNPWKLFQLKPWTLSLIPPASNHMNGMATVNDTIGGNPTTLPLFSDGNNWLSMIDGNPLYPSFTVVGSGTNLYWSNIGTNGNYTASASIFSGFAYAFCYTDIDDSIVYLMGGNGTNNYGYSLDGKSWTGVGTTLFGAAGACFGIACSPEGVYVLVGFGNEEIYSSTTQGSYTAFTARGGSPFGGAGFGVAHNGKASGSGGLFVACGTGSKSMLYSADGTTWTEVPGSYTKSTSFNCVSYGNTVWMMGGDSTGTDTIVTTSNPIAGLTSRGKTDFITECRSLCYNPDLQRWVGVGQGGLFYAYSDDVGATWTTGTGLTVSVPHSVVWNGYCFVLQGTGTNTCAYSVNGISWTPISTVASSVQGVVGSKKMLPWV